jgi:hypothetical protein
MAAEQQPAELCVRLDRVEPRLRALAVKASPQGLTAPDQATGERWDAGQVWAHMAEFIPYWVGESRRVVAGSGDTPTPFGRVKTDPGRIAAIERRRRDQPDALLATVVADIAALRDFLDGLGDDAWTHRGVHSRRGEMSLGHIVDEFLVGHLEEHADQLEGLPPAG